MGDDLPFVDLGGPATWVSQGFTETCAGMEGGQVKCWGYDSGSGALGLGLGGDEAFSLGDEPGEMGDALPYVDTGMNVVSGCAIAGSPLTNRRWRTSKRSGRATSGAGLASFMS